MSSGPGFAPRASLVDTRVAIGSAAVDIRSEIRADERAIGELYRLAFGRDDEAKTVEGLREAEAYLPELSLVATQAGVVSGHAVFTVAHFVPDDEDRPEVPVLSLTLLAVLPDRQGQGIGKRLVETGLRRASVRSEPFVVVDGPVAYFERFGFRPGVEGLIRRLPGYRPPGPGAIRYEV